MNCEEANKMDLVDYLRKFGHVPSKIRGNDYWYLSPLRKERTASFKINRKLNVWFDHGTGEGGTLVDFGTRYHATDVSGFLHSIGTGESLPQKQNYPEAESEVLNRLKVVSSGELKSAALKAYLEGRGISTAIARIYCGEVEYTFGKEIFRGVGFKNDLGGYEIRSAFYKYSSAPKSLSTFCRNSDTVKVFEGFMDFLSYLTVEGKSPILHDIIVLNGTGQFEKSKPFLERYKIIELYLDNDPTGNKLTHNALKSSPKFVDCSRLYRPYNDLNEWLMLKGFSRKSKQALKL